MKVQGMAVVSIAFGVLNFIVTGTAFAGGARCMADGHLQLIEEALRKPNNLAEVRTLSRGLADAMQRVVDGAVERGETVVDGVIPLEKLRRFTRTARMIADGSATTGKVAPYVARLRDIVDHMWDQPGQGGDCPNGECPNPSPRPNKSTPVPGTH